MFGPLIDTIMTKSTFRAFRHRNFAIVEGQAGWPAPVSGFIGLAWGSLRGN